MDVSESVESIRRTVPRENNTEEETEEIERRRRRKLKKLKKMELQRRMEIEENEKDQKFQIIREGENEGGHETLSPVPSSNTPLSLVSVKGSQEIMSVHERHERHESHGSLNTQNVDQLSVRDVKKQSQKPQKRDNYPHKFTTGISTRPKLAPSPVIAECQARGSMIDAWERQQKNQKAEKIDAKYQDNSITYKAQTSWNRKAIAVHKNWDSSPRKKALQRVEMESGRVEEGIPSISCPVERFKMELNSAASSIRSRYQHIEEERILSLLNEPEKKSLQSMTGSQISYSGVVAKIKYDLGDTWERGLKIPTDYPSNSHNNKMNNESTIKNGNFNNNNNYYSTKNEQIEVQGKYHSLMENLDSFVIALRNKAESLPPVSFENSTDNLFTENGHNIKIKINENENENPSLSHQSPFTFHETQFDDSYSNKYSISDMRYNIPMEESGVFQLDSSPLQRCSTVLPLNNYDIKENKELKNKQVTEIVNNSTIQELEHNNMNFINNEYEHKNSTFTLIAPPSSESIRLDDHISNSEKVNKKNQESYSNIKHLQSFSLHPIDSTNNINLIHSLSKEPLCVQLSPQESHGDFVYHNQSQSRNQNKNKNKNKNKSHDSENHVYKEMYELRGLRHSEGHTIESFPLSDTESDSCISVSTVRDISESGICNKSFNRNNNNNFKSDDDNSRRSSMGPVKDDVKSIMDYLDSDINNNKECDYITKKEKQTKTKSLKKYQYEISKGEDRFKENINLNLNVEPFRWKTPCEVPVSSHINVDDILVEEHFTIKDKVNGIFNMNSGSYEDYGSVGSKVPPIQIPLTTPTLPLINPKKMKKMKSVCDSVSSESSEGKGKGKEQLIKNLKELNSADYTDHKVMESCGKFTSRTSRIQYLEDEVQMLTNIVGKQVKMVGVLQQVIEGRIL